MRRQTGKSMVVLAAAWAGACDEADMIVQPRFDTFEGTDLFEDGASARPRIPGTVALEDDGPESERPAVTRSLLERGRTRFDVFCAVCHGRDGYGGGMVVQRGYPAPPSLHEQRLRDSPDEYVFGVITDGLGKMPPYAGLVRRDDRWAIVAYLRALQLSQHAGLDDVPPEVRERLLKQPSEHSQRND